MHFTSGVSSALALLGSVAALPRATPGDIAALEARQTASSLGISVYWGQPGISVASLTSICTDSSYNIVNLAFVTDFFGAKGYPKMNLGGFGPSAAQQSFGATDLVNGNSIVEAIGKCQASGKKVLMSIGGATGTTKFTAEKYAQAAATNIFNLFLGGSNSTTAPIRPFGSKVLDGIDLDPENQQPQYFDVFVKALRAKMNADTSYKYIIGAAPQCPRNLNPKLPGDQSLPDAVLKLVDHVWVQYYNNDANGCNHGQSGFTSSVKAWSTAVSPAKLWIGTLAYPFADTTGYISSSALTSGVPTIKNLKLANLGGYMLWDAEGASQNGNYQKPLRAALDK